MTPLLPDRSLKYTYHNDIKQTDEMIKYLKIESQKIILTLKTRNCINI